MERPLAQRQGVTWVDVVPVLLSILLIYVIFTRAYGEVHTSVIDKEDLMYLRRVESMQQEERKRQEVKRLETQLFKLRKERIDAQNKLAILKLTDRNPPNVLVIYSFNFFASTDDTVLLHVQNFKFFIQRGIMPYRSNPNVIFILLFNTEEYNILQESLLPFIPESPNVKQIWNKLKHPVSNICALSTLFTSSLWASVKKDRSHFILLNSSMRGPFVPNYWSRPWWHAFSDVLEMDPQVVAVSSYFSCEYAPHTDLSAIMLDSRGMDILTKTWHCQQSSEAPEIWNRKMSVDFSRNIWAESYQLRNLLASYKDLNNPGKLPYCANSDPTIPGYHMGIYTPLPYEVMFFKFELEQEYSSEVLNIINDHRKGNKD